MQIFFKTSLHWNNKKSEGVMQWMHVDCDCDRIPAMKCSTFVLIGSCLQWISIIFNSFAYKKKKLIALGKVNRYRKVVKNR
jgi:hypothetical protein